MNDVSNGSRLLKVKDILLKYTDEHHELTIREIIEKLKLEFGSDFHISVNTVRTILRELHINGFEIIENSGANRTVYYSHQQRSFELYELRMLVDAVSSARFIDIGETNQIIKKIQTLTSKHLAKQLVNQITVPNGLKVQNNQVRYAIDRIHTALTLKQILQFQYGYFNVKKEFILRHQGKVYEVTPLSLVWNKDYYYLVARDEGNVKNFRVDRMRNVEVSEGKIIQEKFNVAAHLEQSFNMYPGEVQYVEIHFHKHLINVVIDYFGLGLHVRELEDDTFSIHIKAAVSDGLVRWLLTWGSDAKVVSPQSLVERMKQEADKMANMYG